MHCLKYDLGRSNLDQTLDMPFPFPSASEGFMSMGPGVLLQVGQRRRSSHSTLGRWRGRSDNSIEALTGAAVATCERPVGVGCLASESKQRKFRPVLNLNKPTQQHGCFAGNLVCTHASGCLVWLLCFYWEHQGTASKVFIHCISNAYFCPKSASSMKLPPWHMTGGMLRIQWPQQRSWRQMPWMLWILQQIQSYLVVNKVIYCSTL